MPEYRSLEFTDSFLESYAAREFSSADRAAVRKALHLLDEDDRQRSLRVHELQGDMAGVWSASASRSLRITFERLEAGRKRVLACSHHYGE